jgi:predicted HD phosphohydrolase
MAVKVHAVQAAAERWRCGCDEGLMAVAGKVEAVK